MKNLKFDIKKLMPFILGGLLLILWKFGKNIRLKLQTMQATADAIKQTNEGYSQTININGSEVQINLDTIASEIYYSFYNSKGNKRINEDESKAIQSLTSCPKSQIYNLASVYATKYHHVLKDDLIDKLSSSEWSSVKYLFE